MRYVLVEWPDSQAFIGRSDCYFCQCDDENSFISAIEELYEDNEELSRMSIAGQEIIKKYYSREAAWNSIADDFI